MPIPVRAGCRISPDELFKARTGIDIVPVSYRSGGESVTAVLSQAVQMTFESITILLPLIREGKVRALGITSAKRSPLAPDLPTMAEQGVADYEVLTFNGIVAPKGTPAAIVNKLNAAINEGLKTPEMQDTITKLGAVTEASTPRAVRRLHRDEFPEMDGGRQGRQYQDRLSEELVMAKIVLGLGTSHTPMLLASDETLERFIETDQKIKHRDKEGRPVTYGELLEKADPKLAHMVAPEHLVARQNVARDAIKRICADACATPSSMR